MIDLAQKAKWDDFATHKYAHDSGYKEGLDSAKKDLAKGLRDDGVPLELIAKRTGFSEEEIRKL